MMKMRSAHILPLLCFPLLLLTGCRDDSYRGYEQTYEEYFDPISVVVAVGNPYSKGSGPVEDLEDFEGKDLVIWAYNRDPLTSYTAVRTDSDSLTCLASERRATLNGISNIAKWKDGTLLYPGGSVCNTAFDFYAAHTDDLPLEGIQRTGDQLYMDIEIDGSQDLMVSKADVPAKPEYAFSYLSAQEGVKPIFNLKHCLTRVDLYIQPGITRGFSNYMQIESITMASRTQARMVVVDKDPENMGVTFRENSAKKPLPLTEPDGKTLNPFRLETIEGDPWDTDKLNLQKKSIRRIGGSFFLSPEDQYSMVMYMDMLGYGDGILSRKPVEAIVRLASGESFQQGCRYQVVMTVYGEYAIFMDVQQVPWYSAGLFILDRDAASELIELNVIADDLSLNVGASGVIEPKLLFTSVNGDMEVQERDDVLFGFMSEDPTIASVDAETGEVKALRKGSTKIYVTAIRYEHGEAAGMGQCVAKVTVK